MTENNRGYDTNKNNKNNSAMDKVRSKAEQKVKMLAEQQDTSDPALADLTDEQVQEMVYELKVHQAELEIQNEELRDAHDKLETSRDMYSQLYNQAPAGYLTLDAYGIVQRSNWTFAEMVGANVSDILNRPFTEWISRKDKDLFLGRFKAFYRQPENKTLDMRLMHTKGAEFYVRIQGRHVFAEGKNENAGIIIIVSDVNKEKLAEMAILSAKLEAEKANSVKSEFLAMMSHEIRTPLNGIMGFTNLLLAEPVDEKYEKYIRIIYDSGSLLLSLINDILDVSKIEAGQMEIEESVFSIDDMLTSIDSLAHAFLSNRAKKIDLVLVRDPKISNFIVGDSTRILQVMNNFISNAMKFTPSGKIEYGTRLTSNNEIRFFVRDTGPGIAYSQQQKIFEPFTQLKNDNVSTYSGTGLGLNITKKLIHLMNGKLVLESRTEGDHGSEFSMQLEYKPAQSPEKVTGKKADKELLHGGTILVVEDNAVNLLLTQKLLEKMGFSVRSAGNGLDALTVLQNEKDIQLVLMDMQMPVLDGYEATREIRRREKQMNQKSIPIIALTAAAMQGDREACILAGCNDYITKPVNLEQMENILDKFLTG